MIENRTELMEILNCPICGSKVQLNQLNVTETNAKFLGKHASEKTLDEAVTVLRVIVEKVPGLTIDIANKTALEDYFKRIQDQISSQIVAPMAALIESADSLMRQLANLADKIPSSLQNEFRTSTESLEKEFSAIQHRLNEMGNGIETNIKHQFSGINGEMAGNLDAINSQLTALSDKIRNEFLEIKNDLRSKLQNLEKWLQEFSEKTPSGLQAQFIEIERELNRKIEEMELNATEGPLLVLKNGIEPLITKLEKLASKIPENVHYEFDEVKQSLKESLTDFRNATERAGSSLSGEVKQLSSSIDSLVKKPSYQGKAAEGIIADLWAKEFNQDIVDRMGGPGQADLLIVPYLGTNSFGTKICVERKAGVSQKYCGRDFEQACRLSLKFGASQGLLIYDSSENLPQEMRPLKVILRPQTPQMLTIVVCSMESWRVGRQILEVLQAVKSPKEGLLDLTEFQKGITDMVAINSSIDRLRLCNNQAIKGAEGVRAQIQELEASLLSYENRLKLILAAANQTKPKEPSTLSVGC